MQTLVLSVGPGAMLALLSLGIVLIYRATGTLNFAQGAMASLGAYAYYDLHVSRGLSDWIALVLAVVISAGVGALVEIVVMRHLAGATPLARLIASLGVLIIIQSGLLLVYGSDYKAVPRMLPSESVDFFGVAVGLDRVYLFVIALVLVTVLMAVYRYSRFGRITAAVASNRVAATTLGISPGLVSVGNWALGGALGGLAGAMIAPYSGLSITVIGLLVVPALAAAVVGLLRSFVFTLVGAIVITVLQSAITEKTTMHGAASIVPFVVIVAVLLIRGSAISSRGSTQAKLPAVSAANIRWPILVGAMAVVLVLVWFVLPYNWNAGLLSSILVAIVLLSMVVLVGYTGQISLVQFGLAGMGAFVAAKLSGGQGVPFEPCLLAAVVTGGAISFLLALPALRMRGESLAIVTLAAGAVLSSAVFNGGDVLVVKTPTFAGISLDPIAYPERYATFSILLLALLSLGVSKLRRSGKGRRMLAVRSNERAAMSLGIDARLPKLSAFALSGAIAGIGGVLIAFRSPVIDLARFDPLLSVNGAAWAVVGGIGYLTGPLQGSMFAPGGLGTQLSNLLGEGAESYVPFVGGIVLVLILILKPNGLSAGARFPGYIQKWMRGIPGWSLAGTSVDRQSRGGLLELNDVSVAFGGIKALDGVDMRVESGTIHGLIGPNGAGKTTLVDVVTGFTRHTHGEIQLDHVVLDGKASWARVSDGVVRTWQHLELFEDLSVGENVALGMESSPTHGSRGSGRRLTLSSGAEQAVRLLGLEDVLDATVSSLQDSRKRAVSVARALAMEPAVLVLDEPVAGLDAGDASAFADTIRRINRDCGTTILVIEHDIDFVMSLCSNITVLNFGHVLLTGTPAEVADSPVVREAYLGVDFTLEKEALT